MRGRRTVKRGAYKSGRTVRIGRRGALCAPSKLALFVLTHSLAAVRSASEALRSTCHMYSLMPLIIVHMRSVRREIGKSCNTHVRGCKGV